MSPQFKTRLRRAVRLYLREMRDGCVKCIADGHGAYCAEHDKVAMDVVFNPGKYVRVTDRDVKEIPGPK